MSKVAILTDSNSGITQAQSKDMGVTVIPISLDCACVIP